MSPCPERDRLVDALDERHPASAELRAHAAACGECGPAFAAMASAYQALGEAPDPSPSREALARAAAVVAAAAAPGGARWWRWLAAAAIGLAVLLLAPRWVGLRENLRALPRFDRLAAPTALGALYLVGMAAFFLGRRAWGAFLVAGVAAAVAAGWTEPGYRLAHVWGHLGCLPAGAAIGLGPLVAALALGRGARSGGALAGAAAGLAAGLLGMAVMHLHCPFGEPSHGLIVHAGAALALSAVGAVGGRLVLKPA